MKLKNSSVVFIDKIEFSIMYGECVFLELKKKCLLERDQKSAATIDVSQNFQWFQFWGWYVKILHYL